MPDHRIHGAPAQLLAALDPDATVDDLYGERGSDVYAAMTVGDGSEVREVLRVCRRTRGRILELACGAGRLTVPLARLGRDVVAMDSSPRMLELLSARSQSVPVGRIHPMLGDMSSFDLDDEFGLIVLATTSVTLLSGPERRRMLAAVHRHLAPDGVFLIAVHAEPVEEGTGETIMVPLPGDAPDIVLLSEEVDARHGHRDVSIIRLRRVQGELRTEAFASRVNLLDEAQLRPELAEAGLVVRGAARVRLTTGSRSVSMIECGR